MFAAQSIQVLSIQVRLDIPSSEYNNTNSGLHYQQYLYKNTRIELNLWTAPCLRASRSLHHLYHSAHQEIYIPTVKSELSQIKVFRINFTGTVQA